MGRTRKNLQEAAVEAAAEAEAAEVEDEILLRHQVDQHQVHIEMNLFT